MLQPERCKGTTYMQYFLFGVSEYILVAITISRLVAILRPVRAAEKTTTEPKIIVASIVAASCLLNLHYIWTTEYKISWTIHEDKIYTCMLGLKSSDAVTFLMWFKTCVFFIIPMTGRFWGGGQEDLCFLHHTHDR